MYSSIDIKTTALLQYLQYILLCIIAISLAWFFYFISGKKNLKVFVSVTIFYLLSLLTLILLYNSPLILQTDISDTRIIDLPFAAKIIYNEARPGKSTCFTVTLKKGKDHFNN